MSSDNTSSVFDIDSLHAVIQPEPAASRPAAQAPAKDKGARPRKKSECGQKISALKETHRKQMLELKARYQADFKALRDEMKEQSAKSKIALKVAGENSKKFYETQLKQMRDDYSRQNSALRAELVKYLKDSVGEIRKQVETKITSEHGDRLDSLRAMVHEDFVESMQKKSDEFDQIKALSDARMAELSQENKEKSQRILQMETKMKEISQYLPEDVQAEIYEQFGFEDELAALEEDPKPKRKGLFGRLTSAL